MGNLAEKNPLMDRVDCSSDSGDNGEITWFGKANYYDSRSRVFRMKKNPGPFEMLKEFTAKGWVPVKQDPFKKSAPEDSVAAQSVAGSPRPDASHTFEQEGL